MTFRVLKASEPADARRWLEAWQRWPGKEVSAHPEYVRLFSRAEDRALCATLELDGGGILYPIIQRPLAAEAWSRPGETASDLTTPYGYGGAFVWGTGVAHAETFWDAFDAWARDEGVVTSFARLSLFEEQLLPFRGDVEMRQQNVVRSLALDADAMWRDYAHKVRKNVNRARQSGLRVEVDTEGQRLTEFLDIYAKTMDRRDALSAYRFSSEFFATIVRDLRGSFAFFHVIHGDRIVSTELVLVSDHHVYSFLGGTLEDAFELRPNDLLKHQVIEWARDQGKRAFVLGGGYGSDDGIFRYKASFAPTGVVPFRIGKRVHDDVAVGRLVDDRRAHASRAGTAWEPTLGFFPPYRG